MKKKIIIMINRKRIVVLDENALGVNENGEREKKKRTVNDQPTCKRTSIVTALLRLVCA